MTLKLGNQYKNSLLIFIFSLFVLSACGGGGGSSSSTPTPTPTPEPEPIVYSVSGNVVDEEQQPVDGVLITVDGIQANDLTDIDGRFTVESDAEFETSVLLTAAKEGFESLHNQGNLLTTNQSNSFELDSPMAIVPHNPWGFLEISTNPGRTKASNCDCTVNLSGKVYKNGKKKSKVYALLIIDTSGSTSDESINGKTIFDIEIEALTAQLNSLNSNKETYVGVIKFASTAEIVMDFTNDLDLVESTLSTITPETSGTSGAATNYQAALELAKATFTAANLKKRDVKTVAFLSDGIPTAPSGSGTTQEPGDRTAAIEAANLLAEEGISVNTFPINVDSKLSTLPAVSAITDGIYYQHEGATITEKISQDNLVGIQGLEILNETTQEASEGILLQPDGVWSGNVCLAAPQRNQIKITPVVCENCEKLAYQKINLKCDQQEQECSDCAGQITNLNLQYLGSQTEAKITVLQGNNPNKLEVIFEDTVEPQETFEFYGASADKTMGSLITIRINDQFNAEFVTSCGQPKTGPGRQNGDFVVVSGYSRNGGLLCPVD